VVVVVVAMALETAVTPTSVILKVCIAGIAYLSNDIKPGPIAAWKLSPTLTVDLLKIK
jgi:hypothetical protein